jgi:hypothetical protein
MLNGDIIPGGSQLTSFGGGIIPRLFLDAGEQACRRYMEFFAATIRNGNTRAAYLRAVRRFASWCELHGLRLEQLSPIVTSLYIEELGRELDAPSVKQHLAAIRMLCDWLVIGQVLPMNPVASVRGPKHVVKKGNMPGKVPEGFQGRVTRPTFGTSMVSSSQPRKMRNVSAEFRESVIIFVVIPAGVWYDRGVRVGSTNRSDRTMTITINLSPATEERLRAQAEATGKNVSTLVVEAVEARLSLAQLGLRDILAPAHADFHRSGMTEAELDTLLQDSLDESRSERRSAGPSA